MTGPEIIDKVKVLDLPAGSYVVFGSCPLALAGIRESNDIDMLVSPELFERLRKKGWQQIIKNSNDKPLVFEDFEAHDNWGFTSFSPTLEELLSRSTMVEGIPFASLEDVRKWKAVGARPKDKKDIELIDAYLKTINIT